MLSGWISFSHQNKGFCLNDCLESFGTIFGNLTTHLNKNLKGPIESNGRQIQNLTHRTHRHGSGANKLPHLENESAFSR
jgi:hypothetical protein